MSTGTGPPVVPLERVEIHPDYPGMIRITDQQGSIWHYLQDFQGNLEVGRPVIQMAPGGQTVHLFCPLAPYSIPRVIRVES